MFWEKWCQIVTPIQRYRSKCDVTFGRSPDSGQHFCSAISLFPEIPEILQVYEFIFQTINRSANQLTGFYMNVTLASNELIAFQVDIEFL